MRGVVVFCNPNRGMYAADIGDGEYVIFELLDSQAPELGDEIAHPDFTSMGGETYKNLTQRNTFNVFVENICGKHLIRKLCLL